MFEKYSKNSPTRKIRLTWRFAFEKPSHLIATYFGTGVLRPAPGTWGTLAGLLTYLLFAGLFSPGVWIFLIVLTFFAGVWASEEAGHDLGVHDHGGFVIDEVYAIWLVLVCVPQTPGWYVAAFLAFRFFDIVKIQPAKYVDTAPRFQNGWGVMFDDLVAAVQSILLLRVLMWLVA